MTHYIQVCFVLVGQIYLFGKDIYLIKFFLFNTTYNHKCLQHCLTLFKTSNCLWTDCCVVLFIHWFIHYPIYSNEYKPLRNGQMMFIAYRYTYVDMATRRRQCSTKMAVNQRMVPVTSLWCPDAVDHVVHVGRVICLVSDQFVSDSISKPIN